EEREFKRPISSKAMIAHPQLLTNGLNTAEVRFETLQVLLPGQVRVDIKIATRFHVMKKHGFVETESQLSRIKDVEDDHFMTTGAQGRKVFLQSINRRKEIGDQHHHPAFVDDFRDALQRPAEVGLRSARRLFQCMHQMPQMTRSMSRGKILADLLIEAKQANAVALQVEKI